VRRAIDAVRDALVLHGAPVFVRRAIVHNTAVVRDLEADGAIFVEELCEVPPGSVVVLSAHGVAPAIVDEALNRGLVVYDAVCPLVAKVHREVVQHHRRGRHVVLVGHAGHPEIEGTLGHIPDAAATLIHSATDVAMLPFETTRPLAYAVQTTFSVGEAAEVVTALQRRFVDLAGPQASDICYATTNRQAAIDAISGRAAAIIVVGAPFSSNATRMAEVAARKCASVQLIPDVSALDWAKLPADGGTIGLTAAASTPESSVSGIMAELASRYTVEIAEQQGPVESNRFKKVASAPRADRAALSVA
jgi:4-hydroxy-3-methylbut-2-enyl diphosphate reductase